MAAGNFTVPPSPHYRTDFPLEAKPWHRWLELLYTMPFVEIPEDRETFLVRRLPGDVFTASVRAIEALQKTTSNETAATTVELPLAVTTEQIRVDGGKAATDDKADLPPKKTRQAKTPMVPKLSERQYNILQAMLELNATAVQNRRTTQAIAQKAEGLAALPEQFKRPMSDLKKRKLVDSQDGRDGGSWLTQKGLAIANLLKNKDNTKQ
jgi:hypothetical protein